MKVALALGLTACSFAQTNRLPWVELYTDNRGQYFPAGRTLYATIYMDGHIDFMDTSNHDLVIRHYALSHDEVNEVKEMMAKRAFRKFHGVVQFPRRDGFQDYQTSLEVIVHQPQGAQSFTLQGFDATDGKPFPPTFNSFLCLVDELKNVDYRLSSGCRR